MKKDEVSEERMETDTVDSDVVMKVIEEPKVEEKQKVRL